MRKALAVIVLILIFSVQFVSGSQLDFSGNPAVLEGQLDLSGWDPENDRLDLDGNWAFYWDQLLGPNDFNGSERLTGYQAVPAYWTSYEGLQLPSQGKATYRLLITGVRDNPLLSLVLPKIYTEYNLWINGQLAQSNGLADGLSPTFLTPVVFDFHAESSNIEIILQIRNTSHVFSGISTSLVLGSPALVHRSSSFQIASDMLLTLICLVAGFFSLIVFFFLVKSKEFIHFGILCLAVSLRGLLSNQVLLMDLFPNLSFITGSRLVTLSVPLIVIATLLYTFALYRDDIPALVGETVLVINILYAALIFLTEPFIFSSFIFPYLASVVVAVLLGLFITARIIVRGRADAGYYLTGILLLVAGATNDILNFLQILNTSYLLTGAVSLFVISQAFLLVNRVVNTQKTADRLSTDLRQSKDRAMQTETAFLNIQIKPHFLYNALNTIAEFCRTDPSEAERLILSLARYLRGTLDFDNLDELVTLRRELELVRAYVSIEMARFNNFEVRYDVPPDLLESRLPPLSLQPLVENAIKHGIRGQNSDGLVRILVNREEAGIRCCVHDNGAGIAESRLPDLLRANAGSGVGLYNIHTRLTRLYGHGLEISSKPDSGTRVCFLISKGS